jgi:hypothetical protein
MEWISVKDRMPPEGVKCLFYRPLADKSCDPIISVKIAAKDLGHCWDSTVPDGEKPCNPSDGSCHVTHWMPLPEPPK